MGRTLRQTQQWSCLYLSPMHHLATQPCRFGGAVGPRVRPWGGEGGSADSPIRQCVRHAPGFYHLGLSASSRASSPAPLAFNAAGARRLEAARTSRGPMHLARPAAAHTRAAPAWCQEQRAAPARLRRLASCFCPGTDQAGKPARGQTRQPVRYLSSSHQAAGAAAGASRRQATADSHSPCVSRSPLPWNRAGAGRCCVPRIPGVAGAGLFARGSKPTAAPWTRMVTAATTGPPPWFPAACRTGTFTRGHMLSWFHK